MPFTWIATWRLSRLIDSHAKMLALDLTSNLLKANFRRPAQRNTRRFGTYTGGRIRTGRDIYGGDRMQPALSIAAFIIALGFMPQTGARSAIYVDELGAVAHHCSVQNSEPLASQVQQNEQVDKSSGAAATACSVSCPRGQRRITCPANETCKCHCGPDSQPVCMCSQAPGRGKV